MSGLFQEDLKKLTIDHFDEKSCVAVKNLLSMRLCKYVTSSTFGFNGLKFNWKIFDIAKYNFKYDF